MPQILAASDATLAQPCTEVICADADEIELTASSQDECCGKRRGSGYMGRKNAKNARREEMATQAVTHLARSMREKNELLEERNGMLAFTSSLNGEKIGEEDVQLRRDYFQIFETYIYLRSKTP